MKILYCGVCHSDLHAIKGAKSEELPLVPGHEFMGEVVEIGSSVTEFSIGDKVLVSNIVDSCRKCQPCLNQTESYCREFPTLTYGGIDRIDGTKTQGGYSDTYVADKRFVYHLPEGMNPAAAAPLLCAGITTYSALRHWQVGPGQTVGIVGIGGLGHLAIKFARAMGAHVVAFTTSPDKIEEAKRLGAHEVILSTDLKQMKEQAYRFDFILDNVSQPHNMDSYLISLKMDGTLCSLGIPDNLDFKPVLLTMGRRRISSSGSGGTKEIKEMLEFCQKHNIESDIELIEMKDINQAMERLSKGDVKYRFVIDMKRL
ncbi:MAG: NAD(P)-dependent alcohol dehydrogenase [Flavobacterium sp.]|nr:MAG: NAD(P)-dependent alcohol dehydrogenase [Flavobacterium sp.]